MKSHYSFIGYSSVVDKIYKFLLENYTFIKSVEVLKMKLHSDCVQYGCQRYVCCLNSARQFLIVNFQ